MHTVNVWYASVVNGSVNLAVAGVNGTAENLDAANNIKAPGKWRALALYAGGVNLTGARLNSPSLRTVGPYEIYPAEPAADLRTPVDALCVFGGRGPQFLPGEPVALEVTRGGVDAQPCFGAIWWAPQFVPAPAGEVYTIRCTSTNIQAAGVWTLSQLTPVQSLPPGRYALVGAAGIVNDAFVTRFVFPGDSVFRPGVLNNDAYGDVTMLDPFRYGRMGKFGEFEYDLLPSIEQIGDATGSEANVILLDIIKIR